MEKTTTHYWLFSLGFLIYFLCFLDIHRQHVVNSRNIWHTAGTVLMHRPPGVLSVYLGSLGIHKVHVHMNNKCPFWSGSISRVTALTVLPHFSGRPYPQMQVRIYCIVWKFSILPPGNTGGSYQVTKSGKSLPSWFLDFTNGSQYIFLSLFGWKLLLILP